MENPHLHRRKKPRQTAVQFQFQIRPRWEDLDADCLANVFGRVGVTALLLSVPFVCKSWHTASLNPVCWQRIILPDGDTEIDLGKQGFWCSENEIEAATNYRTDQFHIKTLMSRFERKYLVDRSSFSETQFIKYLVNRSRGHATFLRLPPFYRVSACTHIADVCHGLKGLSLHRYLLVHSSSNIGELIGKLKHLELLSLRWGSDYLVEILMQISIHCKNFCRLHVSNSVIGKEDALAIVNLVPNIKYFCLRKSYIYRDNLVKLLRGCKELVLLDARDCSGFDESDVEILELASHIDKFSCEGSRYGG